jgi:hypothetical protein
MSKGGAGSKRSIAARSVVTIGRGNKTKELPPNSRRIDIPKENRLVEERKYLDVARHEFTDMTPVLKLAKEIVKAQEQK